MNSSWCVSLSSFICTSQRLLLRHRFHPVVSPNVWQNILQFDEHSVNSSHKFGLVYQKKGQSREEEVFRNCDESDSFREFLDFLGDTVDLQVCGSFALGVKRWNCYRDRFSESSLTVSKQHT